MDRVPVDLRTFRNQVARAAASEWSFICTYSCSPSLTLLPKLPLLSDQGWHEILIGTQTLLSPSPIMPASPIIPASSCRKISSGLPLILQYGELHNYFIIYHNVILIEIKCTNNSDALESSGNHLPPPPKTSPWKNCLPQNQSLVPKRLGTTVLHIKLGLWFCLMSLSQLFGLRSCGFCFLFFEFLNVILRHQSTIDILILLFLKMHRSLIPIGFFIQNLV